MRERKLYIMKQLLLSVFLNFLSIAANNLLSDAAAQSFSSPFSTGTAAEYSPARRSAS